MSLAIQIPRTNSVCLFLNADNIDALSKVPEEHLVGRIYETFGYVASAFAYRELMDSGLFPKNIVTGMFNLETQGLYEEGFEDPYGFDDAMRALIDSDDFKNRNKLFFDGIMRELTFLFSAGALAAIPDDEDSSEIMVLEKLEIPPQRMEA
jgi:hypothetical protein